MDAESNSRRIAKNTLFLYARMLFLLLVGLYTSRVVLDALGESDFGIYNVVGGFVALFSIISGTISSAISRFLTFELGRGGSDRLSRIFSSALIVQFLFSIVVIIIAEPAGLWFIQHKMTIDPDRIASAQRVLHLSLLAFIVNMISVPYNAAIIAHEKMGCFAAVGIVDGIARLIVAFAVAHSSGDRLVLYAVLLCIVAVLVRVFYGFYCKKSFAECRSKLCFDKKITAEMFSFAGWNFIGVTASVLRDHGGNLLINLFSGPAVNAARAVALQLNNAVQGFVTNFMTALNPGITKSYASGDLDYMHRLMKNGARFSFLLLLVLALPLMTGTEWLLGIWLKEVPDHTASFVRLFLLFALSESLSNPLITAQLATGKIRDYQLVVGGIMLLNLPLAWVCLHFGMPPESVVVVAIVLSQCCFFARLLLLRGMIGLDMAEYLRDVYLRSIITALVAAVPSVILYLLSIESPIKCYLSDLCSWFSPLHPFVAALLAAVFALPAAAFVGCSASERKELWHRLVRHK